MKMKRLIGSCVVCALLLCGCSAKSAAPVPQPASTLQSTAPAPQETAGKEAPVYVYLTRHGQMITNQTARFVSGRGNTPLTEAGREVAYAVGLGLSGVKFDAAYSSTLGRTQETARIILSQSQTSRDLEIIPIEDLREVDGGSYEPMSYAELMTEQGMQFTGVTTEEFTDQFHEKDPEGLAESYEQMKERAFGSFRKICEETAKNGGGNLLMVAHGGINGMIASEIMEDPNLDPLDNSSIVLIEYKDGVYKVLDFNDLSYAQKAQEKMANPSPVEVYLTVHAETVADAAGRLNGQLDTALTDKGRTQAAELGKKWGSVEFSAVYASDQFKDIDTAGVIVENSRVNPHLMVNQKMELRGVSCGYFDGELHTVTDALADKTAAAAKRLGAYAGADKTGMVESYEDARERLVGAMKEICEETYARGGGNILVVSSELAAQLLAEAFGGGEGVPMNNAESVRITFDGSAFKVQVR